MKRFLPILFVLLAVGCTQGPQDAATAAMAARLEEIARASELSNEFASEYRLAQLEATVPGGSAEEQLQYQVLLAGQLLNAGRNVESIAQFEQAIAFAAEHPDVAPPEARNTLAELHALAYLRLGEQENCVLDHSSQRCLLPISAGGIHQEERGSRNAIRLYTEVLDRDPSNLGALWLLNIAYMTLGEHPDKVPRKWLIPASAFESEYDLPRFEDIAPGLGLDIMGGAGGSIMDDFDGDGYLDIVASSWGLRDQLHYLHNNGDGSFTDRTIEAGLEGIVSGLQIVQGDYNNDGLPDVLVLRGGWLQEAHPNSLLRNNGNGTFSDVTVEAGLDGGRPTQTAAWGDYDNDGWLDIYIGNETQGATRNPPQLFHNRGDGTFTDVARSAGVDELGFIKGVVWGDIDNDDRLDLYVSRLGQTNILYHNDGPDGNGRWTFSDITASAGVAEPLWSFPTWFFDYDNDGWLDLFVSSYQTSAAEIAAEYLGRGSGEGLPKLYRNLGDGTFEDATEIAHVDRIMYTMGSNFGDLDNDGYQDFYVGTGDPSFKNLIPNLMFRNAGDGSFLDVTSSGGFGHLQKGHGVAFGDIDNDGDQDIYMVVGGAFPGDEFQNSLFLNPGNNNAWITLQLEGRESNRMAIGTRIAIDIQSPRGPRRIYSVVSTGGSFGASTLQQEIGLGDATSIDSITIHWPASGIINTYRDVSPNRVWKATEGGESLQVVRTNVIDLKLRATNASHSGHTAR